MTFRNVNVPTGKGMEDRNITVRKQPLRNSPFAVFYCKKKAIKTQLQMRLINKYKQVVKSKRISFKTCVWYKPYFHRHEKQSECQSKELTSFYIDNTTGWFWGFHSNSTHLPKKATQKFLITVFYCKKAIKSPLQMRLIKKYKGVMKSKRILFKTCFVLS